MKKMQEKSKEIQIYKENHKLPLKLSHRNGKHQAPPPPQGSKTRRIEGFGENVSRLPLCVNELHFYIFLLNMVSQEVVSYFNVFGSPVENWVNGLSIWHWSYHT
jgi:hypothetical protein